MRLAAIALVAFVAQAHAEPGMNMSAYSHPPTADDPYDAKCCHKKDCTPWPVEDVEPMSRGAYGIPSLKQVVPRDKVKPITPLIAQYAKKIGADTPYHLCVDKRTNHIYCLYVGEGM